MNNKARATRQAQPAPVRFGRGVTHPLGALYYSQAAWCAGCGETQKQPDWHMGPRPGRVVHAPNAQPGRIGSYTWVIDAIAQGGRYLNTKVVSSEWLRGWALAGVDRAKKHPNPMTPAAFLLVGITLLHLLCHLRCTRAWRCCYRTEGFSACLLPANRLLRCLSSQVCAH